MGFLQNNYKLIWKGKGETLVIEAWGKNSFRVRSRLMGEILDTDFALLPPKDANPIVEIGESVSYITNGGIKAVAKIDGWTKNCIITFYNQKGQIILKEIEHQGALALNARKFKPIIGGDFRLTASFEAVDDEKLYGMGQYQQDNFDIKYCTFELAHRNSQASVPFVLSSRGYGFFWHNPAVGRASFNKNVTEWLAETTKQLDYWITAGDSPAEIIAQYMEATGTPPPMPEYGLGFWQCKLRYWNQEQLLDVAREYKKRGIPVDVIVCDFFHWPKMGDFRFDEEFFPKPKAMVDELKSLGMELMVSVWPQIDHKSENFDEMYNNNLLVRPELGVNICMRFGGESVFFDSTNPEARQYVWEKCKKNYYDLGIKIFWLDEAEPEFGVYDFENYRYFIGSNAQIGNVYPQHYARAFFEGMEQSGQKEIVNLIRCAWAGSQRYGALVWSGDIHSDYSTLRRQIVAGLHMGIAGIPWWTTDIGGFSGGDPNDEKFRKLITRWFQYGTFCPVMRLHGDRKPYTPLTRKDGSSNLATGGDNEVWSYGDEVYGILVKFIGIREAMRDYTRELMRESSEKGSPIIRTMFYEFPLDTKTWDLSEQYMYGPDILVAPIVYEDAYSRTVYLPEDAYWVNAANGQEHKGGQEITVEAPLNTMPVFLRNGKQSYLIKML